MPPGWTSTPAAGLPDPASLRLARAAPIPVAVLTGFLGSGKTSLIKRALRRPDMRDTAVIVNEFGEVGLDHLLVEAAAEDTLLLGNGCLCCAAQGDLVRALRSLLDRRERRELPPYRRVVIETSGLADPAPILQTLMTDPLRLSRYRFAGLTALVDGLLGAATLERHAESRRQVLLADRILIGKTDLCDGPGVRALAEQLRALSPAPVTAVDRNAPGRALLFDFPPGPAGWERQAGAAAAVHGEDYIALSRTLHRPPARERLEAWLADLLARHGDRILRFKGVFRLADEPRPLVLQAVQHVLHRPSYLETAPEDLPAGQLVVIAQAACESDLRRALDVLAPARSRVRS